MSKEENLFIHLFIRYIWDFEKEALDHLHGPKKNDRGRGDKLLALLQKKHVVENNIPNKGKDIEQIL